MSPAIASTNARSVSKATRAGTCRQQNIACALCAHAVVVEKRDDHRVDIVASPVLAMRAVICASEAAR